MIRSLFLAVLLFAVPAAASDFFPQGIHDHLELDYTSQCTLCHRDLVGGMGTVTQPFGEMMRARGLTCCNLGTLENTLDALEGEGTDVDGDGVGDIQELRNGTNPNPEGIKDPPEYGCIGSVAPTRSPWPGATLAAAALVLLVRRRRA